MCVCPRFKARTGPRIPKPRKKQCEGSVGYEAAPPLQSISWPTWKTLGLLGDFGRESWILGSMNPPPSNLHTGQVSYVVQISKVPKRSVEFPARRGRRRPGRPRTGAATARKPPRRGAVLGGAGTTRLTVPVPGVRFLRFLGY